MSQVQKTKIRFPQHADYSERSWQPRCCIKITTIHRDFLRVLIRSLIKARVNAQGEAVLIQIDEESFTYLMEILQHIDNFRLIKSSVSEVVDYGGSDARRFGATHLLNSPRKKTLSK